jgi:hypothetical protein
MTELEAVGSGASGSTAALSNPEESVCPGSAGAENAHASAVTNPHPIDSHWEMRLEETNILAKSFS